MAGLLVVKSGASITIADFSFETIPLEEPMYFRWRIGKIAGWGRT
jgi:hypothetical protein